MSAIVILLPDPAMRWPRDADFFEQRLRERTAKHEAGRHPPPPTRPLLVIDNGPCPSSDWTRRCV